MPKPMLDEVIEPIPLGRSRPSSIRAATTTVAVAATKGLPKGVTAATETTRVTAAAAATAPPRRMTAGIVGATAGAAVLVPIRASPG